MKAQTAACQVCGQAIPGRSDKKYCSDQCRSESNNQKRRGDPAERLRQEINGILRQNRNILRKASPWGKTTAQVDQLVQQGFDLRYFTHQYRTRKGNTYFFCYDYDYLLLPEEKVLVVNGQPYMQP
ncbi:DUF2116 family Zn-ribbon domain-containing protein [Adhaeribacter swui]|uniref:DUF2116 family Zn-ribbon domain-containing protein n=1 Tax=Adhaeribacter swui TaxID=2086471 RepID=A0A7G7GB87_9BACT|nr:DUF2116 family Zn-ribbon domain-containing protein [Adhaeribacter swui]QNF34421.1 DUF2116 family Zn-ribbon domain-containing protein [Adhaeribacter swui]